MWHSDDGRAAYRVADLLVALLLLLSATGVRAEVPSVSVGSGHSMVVEYDLDFQPLRKYTGLEKPVDVTPLADGTILLVDENRRVLLIDSSGTVLWSEQIGPAPQRARLRPGGGWLVTSGDLVMALREDRSVEWQINVKNPKAAAPLPNGNVLIARNEGNGWLAEMTADGTVVWQSKPRGYVDASGRWVDEAPDQFFHSTSSVDASSNGTIFTTDFDGGNVRVLSPDHRLLRMIPGFHHATDTRIGPAGELVAASPEDFRVWLSLPDGTTKSFEPPLRPWCADVSPQKTLLVGLGWEPEKEALNATAARSQSSPPVPWRQRALPVPVIGAVCGLVVALALRRRPPPGGTADDTSHRDLPSAESAGGRPRTAMRVGVGAIGVAVLAGASYLAWQGIAFIQAHGFGGDAWRFAVGCIAAGVVLRALNAVVGCSRTLSSFISATWRAPLPRPHAVGATALVVLSLSSLGTCLLVLAFLPNEQAIAIALWLTAQMWLIAAALPAQPAPAAERAPRAVRLLVGLVLIAAIGTRFWQIGFYPDHVHHDHSVYGYVLLQTLRGNWRPFFVLDPWMAGFARPWLILPVITLKLFGAHYWVLRLTAAIWSVVLAWATYLLGAALFNRRIGLIAALLATANHALLLYSRQPYNIECLPPFILALYCAVVAMKRGCRFYWCLAGMLSAWAMFSIRSCTTFPFIGGAIFLYFLCVYPRWMWRNRLGLLWLLGGAAVVYGPMLPHMMGASAWTARAQDQIVFLEPNGGIRWDAALWAYQLVRSFGAILYYPDTAPWVVAVAKPICIGAEACLFGIGLTYLFLSWRTPATIILISTIGISIFLGSVLIPSPPTYYHFFVGIAFVAFASAVAVDRMLALTDHWRPHAWRVIPQAGVFGLLALICAAHLSAVWGVVRRPPPATDGRTIFQTNAAVVAARFIREHPQYRHYIVRSRTERGCTDPLFLFFAADSDVSDLTTTLRDTLPVPPTESAAGESFIVMPGRLAERETITAVYPTTIAKEIPFAWGASSVWVYLVDAESARNAYDAPRPVARTSE